MSIKRPSYASRAGLRACRKGSSESLRLTQRLEERQLILVLFFARTTHHNLTSLMEMMRPPIYPALEAGKDSTLGILVTFCFTGFAVACPLSR